MFAQTADPAYVNLMNASSFHLAQYLILFQEAACGSPFHRYEIYNQNGEPFLRAIDVTDCQTRCCIGQCHMDLDCTDTQQQQIIVRMTRTNYTPGQIEMLVRPAWYKLNIFSTIVLQVEYPPGRHIGRVHVETCCAVQFSYRIYDKTGSNVLRATSPHIGAMCCNATLFKDINFEITDANNVKVGVISKKMRSVLMEVLTDLDNFTALFPPTLPLEQKILLVGCGLLIDLTHYQRH